MNRIEEMILKAEEELKESFARIDENEMKRTKQVLDLFRQEGVSYRHFAPSTGYGYDDIGRDTLERIYAGIFHTEAALMRPHVASGTAALSLTLFGLTKPGEKIVSATGMPYDTLLGVIGTGKGSQPGSLKEMGVSFECVELKDGKIDVPAVEKAITKDTSLVIAQRSRGYAWRPSLFPEEFAELADMIHSRHPGVEIALIHGECLRAVLHRMHQIAQNMARIGLSLIRHPPAQLRRQGVALLDPDAEKILPISGIPSRQHQIVLIHIAAEIAGDEPPALSHIGSDCLIHAGPAHIQHRRDQQAVLAAVHTAHGVLRRQNIHRDMRREEKAVPGLQLFQVVDEDARACRKLCAPPALKIQQDRRARRGFCLKKRGA